MVSNGEKFKKKDLKGKHNMSEEQTDKKYPRCIASETCCITGFWTDGYDTSVFYGEEILDYGHGSETIIFAYCPLCGIKLPVLEIKLPVLEMDNGSKISVSNSNDRARGASNNLLELNEIKMDSNEKLLRQKRLSEGLTNIKIEQDIRAIWGDLIVEELLEIMDFEELLKWINEPNDFFAKRTPCEVAKIDGIEHIWDFVIDKKVKKISK